MLKIQPYHDHMTSLMEGFMLSGQIRPTEIPGWYQPISVAGRCGWQNNACRDYEPLSTQQLIRELRKTTPAKQNLGWVMKAGLDLTDQAMTRRVVRQVIEKQLKPVVGKINTERARAWLTNKVTEALSNLKPVRPYDSVAEHSKALGYGTHEIHFTIIDSLT